MTNIDQWRTKVGRSTYEGEAAARAQAHKWHSFKPHLVAPQGSAQFKSVLEIADLSEIAFRSAKRGHKISMSVASATAITFAALYIFKADQKAAELALVSLALTLFFFADYKITVADLQSLKSRAKFVNKAYEFGGLLYSWLTFMLVIGLAQLALMHFYSQDEVYIQYGAFYESISKGEAWRFLTGPYLHSGFTHWITNLLVLTLAAPVSATMSRPGSIVAFVLGNIFACIVMYALKLAGLNSVDVYVGVSAGLYAMLGLAMGVAFFGKDRDIQLGFTIALFLTMSLVITAVMNPNAANSAHIAGAAIGIVIALSLPSSWLTAEREKQKSQPPGHS